MSRKPKKPPSKPSKAYLVSFGDTMTALLAFFIVLNSLAKDQTGANMYTGTGSFVQAMKSIGIPGKSPGDRSDQLMKKHAVTPIYAVLAESKMKQSDPGLGPDDEDDRKRVINRQSDNFQRFLSEMQYQFDVQESSPTNSQIVFDSFENLDRTKNTLGESAIQIAADAISQLENDQFELEVVVWANMPSPIALTKAMNQATSIQEQLDRAFAFRGNQRERLSVSAKPWLFVDAKRPRVSFVLSRMDK